MVTTRDSWLLAQQIPAVLVVLNAQGKILSMSQMAAERFGCAEEDWVGQPMLPFIHPADRAAFATELTTTLSRSPQTRHRWPCRLQPQKGSGWPAIATAQLSIEQNTAEPTILLVFETALPQPASTNQADAAHNGHTTELWHLIDALPICVSYTDSQQHYQFVNRTYESWFRCDRVALQGQHISQVIGDTAYALVQDKIEQVLQGETVTYQANIPYKDGIVRSIAAILVPDKSPSGHIRGYFAFVSDMSDRQQLEQALKKTQANFTSILDTLPIAVTCYRLYPDRTIQHDYCSAGNELLFGFPVEQLTADRPLWMSRILPDDRDTFLQDQNNSIQNQGISHHEYRFLHRNNSIRWISSLTRSQWSDEQGCWNVTAIETDITAQKKLELELRVTQEQIDYILGNVSAYLFSYYLYPNSNWEYEYMSVGCEKLFGFTVQEFLTDKQLWLSRVLPEHLDQLEQIAAAVFEGRVITVEYQFLHRDGSIRWIASSHSPEWNDLLGTWKVTGLAMDITDRKALEHKLRLQTKREQALSQVIQAIRNSLDLATIFQTAVAQTCQLLDISYAAIAQHRPDLQGWWVRMEHRQRCDYPAFLGSVIPDEDNAIADRLRQAEVVQIDDTSALTDSTNQSLGQIFPGQWLLIPLQVGSTVWGSLHCITRNKPQGWQTWEVDVARTIADQLAIAIQQSHLFEQVQRLNMHLESQVQQRTFELQRSLDFEALLRRITEKVRDSLNEDHIMQTVVQELVLGLSLDCCDSGIYDMEHRLSTIAYEYTVTVQPAQHRTIHMDEHTEIYAQIFNGYSLQFCWGDCPSIRHNKREYALLVCPIIDDQGILGDLWLFRPKNLVFEAFEVCLVEQVANQCAIAIRQSRLYQKAQEHIQQLEKLNELKDNFLCTVSHELRSPMSNIKMATGMLELLLQQTTLSESDRQQATEYLTVLNDECARETALINDLLELSHLESETDPLMLASLPLRDWLIHIAEPFMLRTQQQQQTLICTIPNDLPSITTDFTYLERIVTELLHNASKYTPSRETIEILVESVEPNSAQVQSTHPHKPNLPIPAQRQIATPPVTVQITIRNTGIEIPSAEFSKIFTKFYRIPNDDPWRHDGTGLGLALVAKRVERLHGQIQVRSQHQTTEFVVQIPSLAIAPPA
ncbi:sensor histidine kinase [Leptolyngbya sp. AN02str]|uniref:PAS domain-containing sensor histidine kinase n=1 Tax=Leptolyngbya sp. AN02str TaxID=3423363 RepID=UPI003D31820B